MQHIKVLKDKKQEKNKILNSMGDKMISIDVAQTFSEVNSFLDIVRK